MTVRAIGFLYFFICSAEQRTDLGARREQCRGLSRNHGPIIFYSKVFALFIRHIQKLTAGKIEAGIMQNLCSTDNNFCGIFIFQINDRLVGYDE